jgi:hypothetical protein
MKSQQDGPGGGVQGEKMGVGSWVDLMSGMWLEIVPYASHWLLRGNMECP